MLLLHVYIPQICLDGLVTIPDVSGYSLSPSPPKFPVVSPNGNAPAAPVSVGKSLAPTSASLPNGRISTFCNFEMRLKIELH